MTAASSVRVRFCPSPTGTPHVGLVRTALFNWAYARNTGGTFVFRIEDTDAARDSEESYHQLLDAMRWLGLDWDEGVEIGGPHEPYRQSQRMDLYTDVAARLLARSEELDALAAGRRDGLQILQGWRYEQFGRDALDLVEGRLAFACVGGKLKMTRTEALGTATPDAMPRDADVADGGAGGGTRRPRRRVDRRGARAVRRAGGAACPIRASRGETCLPRPHRRPRAQVRVSDRVAGRRSPGRCGAS